MITGIRGQDGAYLAKNLLEKGYHVVGTTRPNSEAPQYRLKELGVLDSIEFASFDLRDDFEQIYSVIEKVKPDEIYNLAAQSFVGASFEQPILTSEVDAIGVTKLLEVIRKLEPSIKFYQASTSEMFGNAKFVPQTEDTPFNPRSPYGVAKVYGYWITQNYREYHDIFACSGILYNHESPLRGMEFVTRKITSTVAKIGLDKAENLTLGNLDAKRDWGFAGDYVEGMWRILQTEKPDDFILSTGQANSVRYFVENAFNVIGKTIVWEGEGIGEKGYCSETGKILVNVSSKFYRPSETNQLVGDSTKAKQTLGWEPRMKLTELIKLMVDYDLKQFKNS